MDLEIFLQAPQAPPTSSERKQLIIQWFQKAIDAGMENRKFQSLWEALEEVQDDVEGGNLAAFGLDSICIF